MGKKRIKQSGREKARQDINRMRDSECPECGAVTEPHWRTHTTGFIVTKGYREYSCECGTQWEVDIDGSREVDIMTLAGTTFLTGLGLVMLSAVLELMLGGTPFVLGVLIVGAVLFGAGALIAMFNL